MKVNYLFMQRAVVFILPMLVLTSCDNSTGNRDDVPTLPQAGTLSGVAHLGPIIDSVVTVHAFDGAPGALLGTGVTDSEGRYTFVLPVTVLDQPVVTKISGGRYVEEASGVSIPLQDGQALYAVSYYTSGQSLTVNATYWTTLAAGLAEYKIKVGAPVAQAVRDANAEMSRLLGFNVVTTNPKDVSSIDNKSAPLTRELEYGFFNAAISKWTEYATEVNQAPSLHAHSSAAFAKQAYDDIKFDGVLDGKGSTGALSFGVIPLSASVYRHDLALYIFKMAADGRNVTGLGADKLVAISRRLNDSTAAVFGPYPVIAIDGGGPNITSVLPADQSAVYGTFTASASITDILGLASVTFLINDKFVGFASDVNAPSLAINSIGLGLKDGTHVLAISATNIAGTVKTQSLAINVVNTQTTITNITPTPDSYQRGTTPFKADVSDPAGIGHANIYIDDKFRGTVVNPSAEPFLVDTTSLTDGLHRLRIETTNTAGYKYSVDTTFLTDNTAPVITAATPADNSYLKDTIIVTATASDDHLARIECFLDGNPYGQAADKNAATCSINTLNGVTDGAHTLGIKALDLAGGFAMKNIPIKIDNTSPLIANLYPPAGSVVGNEQFNVGATVDDISLVEIEFLLDGEHYSFSGLFVPKTFIVGFRLSAGTHIITIKATDATGHVSTASTSVVH